MHRSRYALRLAEAAEEVEVAAVGAAVMQEEEGAAAAEAMQALERRYPAMQRCRHRHHHRHTRSGQQSVQLLHIVPAK